MGLYSLIFGVSGYTLFSAISLHLKCYAASVSSQNYGVTISFRVSVFFAHC
jgi:hypothetical protein